MFRFQLCSWRERDPLIKSCQCKYNATISADQCTASLRALFLYCVVQTILNAIQTTPSKSPARIMHTYIHPYKCTYIHEHTNTSLHSVSCLLTYTCDYTTLHANRKSVTKRQHLSESAALLVELNLSDQGRFHLINQRLGMAHFQHQSR